MIEAVFIVYILAVTVAADVALRAIRVSQRQKWIYWTYALTLCALGMTGLIWVLNLPAPSGLAQALAGVALFWFAILASRVSKDILA